jgi:hypothetical protein
MNESSTHSYEVEDAIKYGVEPAVILKTIKFYIAIHRVKGTCYRDGRHWIWMSVREFCEFYPYWSRRQIAHYIKCLVDAGVIVTGHYSYGPLNRTTWYALAEEGAALSDIHEPSTQTDLTEPTSIAPNDATTQNPADFTKLVSDFTKTNEPISPNGENRFHQTVQTNDANYNDTNYNKEEKKEEERKEDTNPQISNLLSKLETVGLTMGKALSSKLRSDWIHTLTSLLKEVSAAFKTNEIEAAGLISKALDSQALKDSLSRIMWAKPRFFLEDWAQYIQGPRISAGAKKHIEGLAEYFLEAEEENGPFEGREAKWERFLHNHGICSAPCPQKRSHVTQ